MKYKVQVFCSGIGWATSKWGGNTMESAKKDEDKLRADDNNWVNPELPRQTRIIEESFDVVSQRYSK